MPTGAISNSPLSVSDTGRFAALILPANDELSTLLSCGLRLMLVIIIAARPLWIQVDASSCNRVGKRSEEHTSELQSLMRISYAVFCLKKKNKPYYQQQHHTTPDTTQILPINT